MFFEMFGVDAQTEGLVGNGTLALPENSQYWYFNVYLVDNNALESEVIIGANKIFDSQNGINQYLQRSKHWIEAGIDYDFTIKINTAMGTEA